MTHLPRIGGVLELEIPLARDAAHTARSAVPPGGGHLRVVLADGYDLFRRGVSEMLTAGEETVEVIGEARDDDEAVGVTARERPDLLLVDLDLPILGARGVIKRVAALSPETPRWRTSFWAWARAPTWSRGPLETGSSPRSARRRAARAASSSPCPAPEGPEHPVGRRAPLPPSG